MTKCKAGGTQTQQSSCWRLHPLGTNTERESGSANLPCSYLNRKGLQKKRR